MESLSHTEIENISQEQKNQMIVAACKKGNLDDVKALVSAKAEVNAVDNYGPTKGYTALYHAVYSNKPSVVQYLVAQNVTIDEQSVHESEQRINMIIDAIYLHDFCKPEDVVGRYTINGMLTDKTTEEILAKLEGDMLEIEKKNKGQYEGKFVTKQKNIERYKNAIHLYKKQIQYQTKGTMTLRKRIKKETVAEMDSQESATPIKKRKRKPSNKGWEGSHKESITPTKGRKRKRSFKDGVEGNRMGGENLPSGTPRSFPVTAKNLLDPDAFYFQVNFDFKQEKGEIESLQQNRTMEGVAEGSYYETDYEKKLSKSDNVDDFPLTEKLKMLLAARKYEKAKESAHSIIKDFKLYFDEREKYLVYTAWIGYLPYRNGDVELRIVSLVNRSSTATLPDNYSGIPIRWRGLREVSSEAEKTTYLEDIDVNIKHEDDEFDSRKLFREHSNLTMIHVSSFKSTNFGTKEQAIVKQPCIALYCRVKGIIPLGENPFPTRLGKLPTDVREGYCTFGAGDALRPGIEIQCREANKCGTIGGFIEYEDGTKRFITAAHIFANTTELKKENATKEARFRSGEIIVHREQEKIGKVVDGFFSNADENSDTQETSIDAAVVEIDQSCVSTSYSFPETEDATLVGTGYSSNQLPKICSNRLICRDEIKENRRSQVMKYGASTLLTTGVLKLDKVDVMFDDGFLNAVDVSEESGEERIQPFLFCRQMGVESCCNKPFFDNGDSGAFCFMIDKNDEKVVQSFGLAIGKTSFGICIVTPLEEVFRKLGFNCNQKIAISSLPSTSRHIESNESTSLKRMFDELNRKLDQGNQNISQELQHVRSDLASVKKDVEILKEKVKSDTGSEQQ